MKQDEESKSVKPEQEGPPFYDMETGEYLGGFKSKKEAKDYFLSIGMSEEDYDWLEANKDNLFILIGYCPYQSAGRFYSLIEIHCFFVSRDDN